MALHIITVVIFTVFLSEALTLTCFNCTSTSSATCTSTANCSPSSQCSSMTTIDGINMVSVKSCAAASCVNFSINLELIRMSSKCCSSDYCNNATASDSENGLSCNGTVSTLKCKGGENQCITVAAGFNGVNRTYKGCASQNICLNSALVILPPGVNLFNFSCFEANNTQGLVSAGTSTFFHLKSVLDGFLLVVLVFEYSVLSL